MFEQKWTPFLSYPKSHMVLNESGIGLPSVMVSGNGSFMFNLYAPGIFVDYDTDPGHSSWIPHPNTPIEDDKNSAVKIIDRNFLTYKIESKYEYHERIIQQQSSVYQDKVVTSIEIDENLEFPVMLKARTLGECTIKCLKNGLEVNELGISYKPLMYRIMINAWTQQDGKIEECEVKISVDGMTIPLMQYHNYEEKTSYVVELCKGTRFVEIVLECSRNGFQAAEEEVENLQASGTINTLIDEPHDSRLEDRAAGTFAASPCGTAKYYMGLAYKSWKNLEKNMPEVQLPDKRMQDFLHYNFIIQMMNELPTEGLIAYPATMPKQTFWGFWMWDFSFHSIASRWIKGRRLSKGCLLNMINMQWENGCITNSAQPYGVQYFLKEHGSFRQRVHPSEMPENAIGGTHPPVLGYAVKKILEVEEDIEFIKRILPMFIKYNRWFEKNRLSEKYPDLLAIKKWSDSGQDNSKRWGEQVLSLFGEGKKRWWDFPILPVDINVHWAIQNEVLGTILHRLGEEDEAQRYLSRANRIRAILNEIFWDEQEGFYFDIDEESGKRIPVFTPAGFYPLLVGAADKNQYSRLKAHLTNPNKFSTQYPLPTLAADDEDFAPVNSYWMGTVWMYHNYFVTEGLFNYDKEAAFDLLDKSMMLMNHRGFVTCYENYNAHNGEGYNAANFLWNGMLGSTIVEKLCGIQPQNGILKLEMKDIPDHWNSFSISKLPIFCTTIDVEYEKDFESMKYKITNTGDQSINILFSDKQYLLNPCQVESLIVKREKR